MSFIQICETDITTQCHDLLSRVAYKDVYVSFEYAQYEYLAQIAMKPLKDIGYITSRWIDESPDDIGWVLEITDTGKQFIKDNDIAIWQKDYRVDGMYYDTEKEAIRWAQYFANQTGTHVEYDCYDRLEKHCHSQSPDRILSDYHIKVLNRIAVMEFVRSENASDISKLCTDINNKANAYLLSGNSVWDYDKHKIWTHYREWIITQDGIDYLNHRAWWD